MGSAYHSVAVVSFFFFHLGPQNQTRETFASISPTTPRPTEENARLSSHSFTAAHLLATPPRRRLQASSAESHSRFTHSDTQAQAQVNSQSQMSNASSTSSSSALSNSMSVVATAATYAHSHCQQQQHGRATPLSSIASIKQFPEIQLTLEEQAHYDRVVGRLLYRAVQEYSRYTANGVVDRNAWTPVRSNHNMAIYRGQKGPTDNPLVSRILGVGKLDGKLEDVLDGLYADTSSELRKVMTLHESKCTITKVFHVSETRSPERPFAFAGIKWFASKMPGSGVTTNDRDLLYYERQGLTFDTEGNEIAYHLIQSIDRPEWPANTFKHLIRSHSSVCYLHKRRGNRVETFCWGDFYGSGSIPQLVANYAIAGKLMSVKNALKCSEAKKLSQLRESVNTRSSTSSITISEINLCHMCEDRRTLFSSQQLCGGCQQNVCRSCSEEKKLFQLDRTGRPLKDRFCKKCLVEVARQRGSRITCNGVRNASEEQQQPSYFDLAFQSSNIAAGGRGKTDSSSGSSSSRPTFLTSGSMIDTKYMDEALARLDKESRGLEDSDWQSYEHRKRSHVERVSSSSYSKEQFLADLFEEIALES